MHILEVTRESPYCYGVTDGCHKEMRPPKNEAAILKGDTQQFYLHRLTIGVYSLILMLGYQGKAMTLQYLYCIRIVLRWQYSSLEIQHSNYPIKL